jgi:hypothetical protein
VWRCGEVPTVPSGAERVRRALAEFLQSGIVIVSHIGRSRGVSLIRNEDVKRLCRSVIQKLPKRWSAKLFQKAISAKLKDRGLLHSGATEISFWRVFLVLWLKMLVFPK